MSEKLKQLLEKQWLVRTVPHLSEGHGQGHVQASQFRHKDNRKGGKRWQTRLLLLEARLTLKRGKNSLHKAGKMAKSGLGIGQMILI